MINVSLTDQIYSLNTELLSWETSQKITFSQLYFGNVSFIFNFFKNYKNMVHEVTFNVLYLIKKYIIHQQLGVVLLWLHLFILSGVTSSLISRSILGTYQPGEFIFQCPIFLPFHAVHGVLKAKILKWFCHSRLQRTMFCQNCPPGPWFDSGNILYLQSSSHWIIITCVEICLLH